MELLNSDGKTAVYCELCIMLGLISLTFNWVKKNISTALGRGHLIPGSPSLFTPDGGMGKGAKNKND